MKIVFFGTPDYVLPVLEKLHKQFRTDKVVSPVVAVVTQSPKPTGRKQIKTYSPVDAWAHQRQIPVHYDARELLMDKVRADIGVVAAYGALLPERLTSCFRYGMLVIHPSLLPQFRWSSPVQAAIATGTNPTGVSIIKMDAKFDHGPIVAQFKEDVLPDDTTGSLRARLFERSAEVLVQLVEPYIQGKIMLKKQDESKATFARMIKKEDAFIPPEILKIAIDGQKAIKAWGVPFINDYSLKPSAQNLDRFIKAMNPWPCAWTYINLGTRHEAINNSKKRLKILEAHLEKLSPSAYREATSSAYKLVPDLVQLEGKEPVSWGEFMRGYPTATLN
jgi:methionyl-tRNA formyltransferase